MSYQLSPPLSPTRDPLELQFQLLGTKPISEVGLLPAGFHPLPSDRPCHLPTLHRAASMGSLEVPSSRGVGQLCPRDTVHPRTYRLTVGCDHVFQNRLEWPGQERDGVAGSGVCRGLSAALTVLPALGCRAEMVSYRFSHASLGICMRARRQVMLGSCWDIA